jgi:hypothetical protein
MLSFLSLHSTNNLTMSSKPTSVPKCESAKLPEVTTEKKATTAAAATEHEESIKRIGMMIQDLFHSNNAIVNAALDALSKDLIEDKKKCESLVTAGGCFALVQFLKNCLDKAIDIIPACDQVTALHELPELTTLHKTLSVITRLNFRHHESNVGIAAIGGVEVVVKVMKTFPKCQALQELACCGLRHLTYCSIGKAKCIESCGIEVLLDAITTHLDSEFLCQQACGALLSIASDSKEITCLLIILGGGAAVAKVSIKWRDDGNVFSPVRSLANLVASEMHALAAIE